MDKISIIKIISWEFKRAFRPFATELLFIVALFLPQINYHLTDISVTLKSKLIDLITLAIAEKLGAYSLIILPLTGIIIANNMARDIENGEILLTLMLLNNRIKTILTEFLSLTIFYGILITVALIVKLFVFSLQITFPIFLVIYLHLLSISLISSSIAILFRNSLLTSIFLILFFYTPVLLFLFGIPFTDKALLGYLLGMIPSMGLYGLIMAIVETISINTFYNGIFILTFLSLILFLIAITIFNKTDLVI